MGLAANVAKWLRWCRKVSSQAGALSDILPRSAWYATALTMARVQGRIASLRGGNRRLSEAILFDTWLREFTLRGAFPIPARCVGEDVLESAKASGRVLFCWQHLPLCGFSLGFVTDHLREAPHVVAAPGHILPGDRFVILGRAETAPALSLDRPVLTRLRTLLREGRSVVCLADTEMGGEFSDYAMRVAGKTGARVVFSWTALQADGALESVFRWAPRPQCESDEAIAENMEFLSAERQRVLASLGWKSADGTLPTAT